MAWKTAISEQPGRQWPPVCCTLRLALGMAGVALLFLAAGCTTPIGADKAPARIVFQQVHGNQLSTGQPSSETRAILHRFDLKKQFEKSPDTALQFLHQKAIATGDNNLLYALSELNFTEGERQRHSSWPWDPRDDRDYYLASAVYAWFFLLAESTDPAPGSLRRPVPRRVRFLQLRPGLGADRAARDQCRGVIAGRHPVVAGRSNRSAVRPTWISLAGDEFQPTSYLPTNILCAA